MDKVELDEGMRKGKKLMEIPPKIWSLRSLKQMTRRVINVRPGKSEGRIKSYFNPKISSQYFWNHLTFTFYLGIYKIRICEIASLSLFFGHFHFHFLHIHVNVQLQCSQVESKGRILESIKP